MRMQPVFILMCLVVGATSTVASAYESTKILPKGIWNPRLRFVHTDITYKSNNDSQPTKLGSPLEKNLTFKEVLASRKGNKRVSLAAFMLSNGFQESDVLGSFQADLNARLQVFAPIIGYGITDNISLALAVPVYVGESRVSLGFSETDVASNFAFKLAEPQNNQLGAASEAINTINTAPSVLNDKLRSSGYDELSDWEQTAFGDVRLGVKWRFLNIESVSVAGTLGAVAPTGKGDNPNQLTDLPFGDEQWDGFATLAVDNQLLSSWGLVTHHYATYTHQFSGKKSVRLKTALEPIEVPVANVGFKLGNKIEAGTGVSYALKSLSVTSFFGYRFYEKSDDSYEVVKGSKSELEKNTYQQAHYLEANLGFSGVEMYRQKKILLPFMVELSHQHIIKSQNMPVAHQTQLELSLFF